MTRRAAVMSGAATFGLVGLLALVASLALADARTDYLMRLLRTSDQFRVRAQAALSLGSAQDDPTVVRGLGEALRDEHPAVRAAAAASLERQGDPSALEALRGARSDPEPTVRSAAQRAVRTLERIARTRPRTTPVPPTTPTIPTIPSNGPARFYVGVGLPGSKAPRVDRATLEHAREFMLRRTSEISGVVVAPQTESAREAQQVISRRRLTGYYLDSSITSVETRPDGSTRAAVSVIVQTYPGRDIRVMLGGAATVSGGGSGAAVQQQAIEAALTGALRRLPQSLDPGGTASAP